jgi:pimeloyl-ACP methyl ester carboxylesterase
MGATGIGLVVASPGDRAMEVASWMWPPLMVALAAWVYVELRRSIPGRTRWVLTPVLTVLVLASVGALYGNIAVARDRGSFPAAGELYDVGGHRLHIDCRGTGSPTVVLSNSAGGTSAGWARISSAVSVTTRVCAYDRAGQGWSEEASSPRDGIESARELHTLLAKAGEHGPYVLVGHSTGGTYAMTYAARHPEDVAGLVLLDSSSPDQFEMPAYPDTYAMLRRLYGLMPTVSRVGITHLTPGASLLPAPDAARVDAVTSAPKSFRNQHDEVAVIPQVFRQAKALTTLGDKPLAVVTASETATNTEGWVEAQDELVTLSSNVVHQTVESSHMGLVEGAGPADASVRAIDAVVTSVRSHRPLPSS